MHILIASLYAGTIWLSLLAYTIIIDGYWPEVVVAGPVIISSTTIWLLVIERLANRVISRLRRPKPEAEA